MIYKSRCPSLTNTDYDASILQRRYIEIMQVLLLSGANPDALVFDYERKQSTAVEVVKNILAPRFPYEAGPLLNALQQELGRKFTTKRKQPYDNKDREVNNKKRKDRKKRRRR